jgi:hypothetical protein
MNLLNLIEDSNTGYDNLRALMQAVQNSQDALLTVGSEPVTLTYPEARFIYGKYKAYLKAGRQEEFINDLGNAQRFDMHMKQLRQLLDKQKNFRGSVPGQRGITGDVPQGQLDEIGNTPAGQAALKAVGQRADDTMSAWSANPKSGYSSTPTSVAKASNASVAASNRQYGFGIDQSKTNTVMARDALRKQQAQQGVAEGYDPVESDFKSWVDITRKETMRDGKTNGANSVEIMARYGGDDMTDIIRNILAYVKQNRQELGREVSEETGRTVKDCIIDIRNKFPQEYQAAQQPQGQVNELSSDLLRKSAQMAKDKSDQAMNPKIHDALGGGYMNPVAKHYDSLSQKFSNRAVKVGQRDAVKKIASPAVMRKIGMAEAEGTGKIGGWIYVSPKVDGSEHYARFRNLDTNQDETKTFQSLEDLAKWLASTKTGFDWGGYAPNPPLVKKLLDLHDRYQKSGVAEQTVEEIAMSNPERPTAQTAGKINWERMIKDYMDNKPYSEFEFSGDRPLTLYRSQVFAILKDFGRMKPQQKVNIILNTFGDKYAMVDYIDRLRAKGMMPKKVPAYVSPNVEPVPPGQMSFPGMASPKIKEAQAQKKNSEQTSLDGNTARSPKVQRAFQLARARQSAAGSDIEAFVKDELEKSEQAQTQLDQLQAENDRQDQQIQQLAAKVRQQDQEINQVQQPTAATPAKSEPPKETPKAAEPDKKSQPVKKAEPRAAEKSAEPARRDKPRAEPAPAKTEKPTKVDQPKSDDTQIQRPRPEPVEVPANVLQFPTTAQRKKNKKAAAAQVDPMAAAMQGVDMIDMGRAVGMNESSEELHMGDPVIIRGNVEHSGKTGDVAGFGRDKHFVIVDLYNFGRHAFHASNIEYNNHDDYIDENQRMDKFTIAQPIPGGSNKQREAFLDARDRLFRQMQSASPGEKEAIRLKIAELEGRAQSQGIRIRETDDLNRSGYNAIKSLSDWAEKMRVMRELQKDIALMSDPEAKASVQQRIGDLLKVGIKQGYIKEALNDKAMAVLRSLQQPAQTAPTAIDLNVPAPAEPQMDLVTVRKKIAQLDELIRMKEQIDKLFVRAQNARGGIYPGLQSDIEDEELYGVPQTDKDYQILKDKYTKDLLALQKFIAMKKAVYREGREIIGESSALVRLKRARQALSQQGLNEYAPGQGGGGSGNYFQALASAWYNGAFDTGSLQKGIKSKEDVERLLNRGIVGPDGVTRKYAIDYNSNFDGVVISSDDYYEHSDYNDRGQEVDSRNGRPWGPNDYMEFSDDDLSESQDVNEFAPAGRDPWGDDDGGEDPYGRPQPRHYNRSVDYFSQFEADHFDREDFDDATGVFKGYWGDDQIAYFKFDNPQRNGSDDPGMGWYYEPQNESVAESWKNVVAGSAMALGALGAQAQTADLSGYNTQYLQQVAAGEHTRPMVSVNDAKAELQARANGKQQATAPARIDSPSGSSGYSKEYLQKAADPNRFGRYMISVEKAQELLNKMNEDVVESLADEFMKMAKDMGMNPRLRGTPDEERARTAAMLKQRAADRANAPKPTSVSDEERANLEARLKELEARFDPDFEYSDDYSFWSKQNDIKKNINSIKQRLSQGVAEGFFGGTAKAAAGQLKTYAVYDGFTVYYDPAKEMFVTAGTGEYKDKFRARGFPALSAIGGVSTAIAYGEKMTGGQRKQPISMDRSVVGGAHESVAEAQTDYQKRRQRERDVDAGKPVSRQPKNPQNDYFARRKKEKKHDMDEAISKKDLLSRLQKDLPKVNDPKNKDANPVVWTGPGKNDYGYTGYQGHGMPTDKQERDRIRADKKKGVAEGTPFDQCPGCGGPIVHVSMLGEKQDACYHKVRSRYKVWPSAYASGALVQCRKKGADNWGNSGKKK